MTAPALSPDLAVKLVEELVYQRILAQIDLVQLAWFESDLDDAIHKLLTAVESKAAPGDTRPRSEALAAALLDRAWARVEEEWRRTREEEPTGCPLCDAEGV